MTEERTGLKLPLVVLLDAAGIDTAGVLPEALRFEVSGFEYDSRNVSPGMIFFAMQGSKADGRAFAADAIARGAVAVISDSPKPAGFSGAWIQAPHTRRALALMSRRMYPRAAELIRTVATGTNGKSTTCCAVDAVLRAAGHTTVLVGTIAYRIAHELRKAVNTTPESLDLYRLFEEGVAREATHATLEVSSHALHLGRVWGMRFDTAIWTQLSQDHLDFHRTMDNYFAAKCELFRGQDAPPPRFAILNADDEWAHKIPLSPQTGIIWYGMGPNAALRAGNIRADFAGLRFDIHWQGRRFQVSAPLIGRINVYNLLAAFGALVTLGLDTGAIVSGIESMAPVPGRFERLDEGQPFVVAVDYAHTDDALRRTLQVARELGPQRILTVFGCGGDRDRNKRPLMGQAAGEGSDYVVVTSDNPRSEDPLAIINDTLVGLRRTDTPHIAEPDRAKAIRHALAEARAGDLVLIAGKGHEDYQVLRGRTIAFDDREVSRGILKELGYSGRKA